MQHYDYGASEFTCKGYGVIYVLNNYDIEIVNDILRHLDEEELRHYGPVGLIASISEFSNELFKPIAYIGKFDLPEGFKNECIKRKVAAYVYNDNTDSRTLADIKLVLEDTKRKLELDLNIKLKEHIDKMLFNREEILEAFVAKYGANPDQVVQVSQYIDGKYLFYVTTKDKMGVEQ